MLIDLFTDIFLFSEKILVISNWSFLEYFNGKIVKISIIFISMINSEIVITDIPPNNDFFFFF